MSGVGVLTRIVQQQTGMTCAVGLMCCVGGSILQKVARSLSTLNAIQHARSAYRTSSRSLACLLSVYTSKSIFCAESKCAKQLYINKIV